MRTLVTFRSRDMPCQTCARPSRIHGFGCIDHGAFHMHIDEVGYEMPDSIDMTSAARIILLTDMPSKNVDAFSLDTAVASF
jgi:hypothetical protein